jgi:hypothetical protein
MRVSKEQEAAWLALERPKVARPAVPAPLSPYVCVTIPLRTVNATNVREHHMARSRRVKREHEAVRLALIDVDAATRAALAQGCTVTMTRASAGTLDDDGLRAALKSVRDCVAVFLLGGRIGQHDSDPRIVWDYKQLRTSRGACGVVLSIRPVNVRL